MMRNSKYIQEFRDSSIQLAINSEKSTAKIAVDLDVNEKTLYNWIRQTIHQVDEKLNELIEIAFIQGRQNYGTRRISYCATCCQYRDY